MKFIVRFSIVSILLLTFGFSVFSQQIVESELVSKIIKEKKRNPKISDTKLAGFANELLAKEGFNYHLEMSKLFFQKTSRMESLGTQKEQIIKFPFEFKLANKSKKTFELRAKHNLQNECFDESTPAFPVTQITENMATVLIEGNPIALLIPKEFDGQTIYLLDSKTRSKVLRKWIFPYSEAISEENFLGFSADGKKLYLTVKEAYSYDYDKPRVIRELALEISTNGKLNFVPKAKVRKKFKMVFAAGKLSEDVKADFIMKITIGGKVYYVASPAMTC